MASINFLLRSTKKNDPFTVRLQFNNQEKVSDKNPFGLDFVEAKTEIYVFTPDEVLESPLSDGKRFWSKYKKYKGKDLEIMNTIVRALNHQNELRDYILSKYDKDFKHEENPDKIWLSATVKKYYDELKKKADQDSLSKVPTTIIWHFDNYIRLKKNELAENTILKMENIKNILSEFQEYQSSLKGYNVDYSVSEVNAEFKYLLESYLRYIALYSYNTITKIIRITRTVCNFSKNYGIVLHPMYNLFKKSYEEIDDIIYLSFSELKTIKNSDKITADLEDARDWLYISCFLGQRISDFMKFTKNMIRKNGDDLYIDFTQIKTGKKISLLLHFEVVSVLEKRDMNFPEPLSEHNYNKKIKEVCKLAGLNEMTEGSVQKKIKDGVWRNVKGTYEKWELVVSHIGRKSYCTNFYSRMPTSLILEVSGHTAERTLLEYIGKKDNTNSQLIKNYYSNIDITQD